MIKPPVQQGKFVWRQFRRHTRFLQKVGNILDMNTLISPIVTSIGLVLDIGGGLLIANEVVRVFSGPATIDVGDAGAINGGTHIVPNPQFEAHERKKRKIMSWGLGLLFLGFIFQGGGTWLSYFSTAT